MRCGSATARWPATRTVLCNDCLVATRCRRRQPPRSATRKLRRDWWIHSFSQLHRQKLHGVHALQDEAPAIDERPLAATPTAVVDAGDPRLPGERFGNAVHHALEHADFRV